MPYRQTYYPAPKNPNLKVHSELPSGVKERHVLGNRREADGIVGEDWLSFHFCPKCGGWIEGDFYMSEVHTLNSRQLAGRSGTEYYCRRCGYQVDFFGMMS